MAKPYKGKMKKFGNILWGLVLVIIGIIFALNALGITDINIFLLNLQYFLLFFYA